MLSKTLVKVIYIIINIILSLSLVLLNKWIYSRIKFPNLSLTLIHFISTFIGLIIIKSLNIFSPKSIESIKSLIPLAFTFAGFVVFCNLSLQFNTIGTYQIIKTLTFPTIILIQTYFYEKVFTLQIKLTLVSISFIIFYIFD